MTYQLKVVERRDRRKQAKAALFSYCEAYTALSNCIGQTHCSVTCSVSLAVWIVDCAIITLDTRGECSAEKSQGGEASLLSAHSLRYFIFHIQLCNRIK